MAKKKNIEDLVAANDYNEKLISEIERDFGDSVIRKGESIAEDNRMIIPFSPAIDLAFGGGVLEGAFLLLSGPPKVGKTTSCLDFCATCQKPEYGGREIYYLNIEGRLKQRDLSGIKGLDKNKVNVVSSTKDKMLSAQNFLDIGEKILMTHPGCVLVVDSFSMLLHEREMTEGSGTALRGATQALTSQFCRKVAQILTPNKSILIGINQIMSNPGGYGPSTVEKSGFAVQFSADFRLKAKGFEAWKASANAVKSLGQIINWRMECSGLPGAPPGQDVKGYIRYGFGIDKVMEILQISVDTGLITASGSWLSCEFMKDYLDLLDAKEWNDETQKKCKFHGSDKLRQQLENNPDWFEALNKSVKIMLG